MSQNPASTQRSAYRNLELDFHFIVSAIDGNLWRDKSRLKDAQAKWQRGIWLPVILIAQIIRRMNSAITANGGRPKSAKSCGAREPSLSFVEGPLVRRGGETRD